MIIRIGTRRSALALKQANIVGNAIVTKYPNIKIEITEINTTGDILYNKNLATIGGKGLFLKEIEEAIMDHRVDIGVHSMKDVPHFVHPFFKITPILQREAIEDVIIFSQVLGIYVNKEKSLQEILDSIPGTITVGTCSIRRKLYIKNISKNCIVVPIRGNIETRIQKLNEPNNIDCIILAKAGLNRMNIDPLYSITIPWEVAAPAPGQGSLAVEYRAEDHEIEKIILSITVPEHVICIETERKFMARVEGNCNAAIAAYAKYESNNIISFYAMYCGPLNNNRMRHVYLHYPIMSNVSDILANQAADVILK